MTLLLPPNSERPIMLMSNNNHRAILTVLLLASGSAGVAAQDGKLPNNAGWNVEADPAAEIKGPFNVQDGIPVGFGGHVVFPTTASAFVAVTPPKTRDTYQVYDLRTMQPVGKPVSLTNKFDPFVRPALAPDGKHLALRVKPAGGKDSTIEVWSTETGASVLQLPVEPNTEIKPRYYDLLGKDRLWVGKHK